MTRSETIPVIPWRGRTCAQRCLQVIIVGLSDIPNSKSRGKSHKRKPKSVCIWEGGDPQDGKVGDPSLAHIGSPCGRGALSPRRCMGGRVRAPGSRRRPDAEASCPSAVRAVCGPLRASSARGGGLAGASANPRAAPPRLSPSPASACSSPDPLGGSDPPTGWRAAAQPQPKAS